MAPDSRLFAPAATTASPRSSPSHFLPRTSPLTGEEGLWFSGPSSPSCSRPYTPLCSSSYKPSTQASPVTLTNSQPSHSLAPTMAYSEPSAPHASLAHKASPSPSAAPSHAPAITASPSSVSSSSSSSVSSCYSSTSQSISCSSSSSTFPTATATATTTTTTTTTTSSIIVQSQSSVREAPQRWAFWPLVLLIVCLPKEAACGHNERRLLHDLLDSYNPLERPVHNESEPVVVSFGITLQQIIDVDEKNQLLITNTWLKLEWNDVNLRWNESDYGNVKDLRIPPYKIWKPDVLMYNSADEGFDGTYQTKVVVSSTGNCLYIPPGIFKSTCKIDITWFPFDDQRCKMKFGSWTYSGWQLDLQLQSEDGGDLSDFIKNGEWDLIGCPGKRNSITYKCCPEPYVDVTFEIVIRRRTLYYFCNLILPCVLIASMAVLGFTLPPDCGEKLSLGVAVMLSLYMYLEYFNAVTPVSAPLPTLGTYFNCIMFMVASSVVSTVLILNYHHRSAETHEMSPMVKSLFLQWLPWVLRLNRPGEKITRKTIMMNNKMRELELKVRQECPLEERSSKSLLANVLDIDDDFRAHTLPHTHTTNTNNTAGFIRVPHGGHSVDDSHLVHTCMSSCTRELNLILKEIRIITDKMRKEDEESEVKNDWRFAAMVLDRLCLIIFTLFTITATVAVLLSAPHIIVP
ncbi:acetylcholine receptor subunit alpha-type acr-16-like isoform X6 [Portunus trituberculatus]|uniref:acetylcholine receptor subunit alpha-type acr-16-like isoform X6 n=1 Tax=Portunus trituberculatus TaxID=210409 RepID=UPI001E1D1D80|nr:acetylcholine receptor subunit alpha-type acr-16-like isoform X6 [Portunus trituberculatus]